MKPPPAVYVVPWFYPPVDGQAMGKPETSTETLTTRTVGLLISSPFGKDTDCMLEIYADIATGAIVASIAGKPCSSERVEERRWEPYVDNRQWGTKRSKAADDRFDQNGASDVDED